MDKYIIYIISLAIFILSLTGILFILLTGRFRGFNLNKKNKKQNVIVNPIPNLGYKEIMEIIEMTIDEIWKNKYFLYYRLKEIRIIANMDEEATAITKEVIESFTPEFMQSVMRYYTIEYFTKLITRKSQMLLVDYTNTYKPNTK